MTHSNCYEKGHTPGYDPWDFCVKCGELLHRVTVDAASGQHITWHTQAELDRLWQGVDREATRVARTDGHG